MKERLLALTLGTLLASFACSTANDDDDDSNADPVAGRGASTAGKGGSGTSAGNGGIANVAGKAGANAGAPNAGRSAMGGSGGSSGSNAGTGGGSGANAAGAGGTANLGGGAGASGAAGASGTSDAGSAGASAGASGAAGGGGTGLVENGSADCPVPELADPASLPRIDKFPDPFKRIDGTRLTKKSEWRCRRQEIIKQAERYIYGEKPAFDSVSGTVTNTQVTVHVEALGKSIDFSASIKLPSTGTAPYPAIINIGSSGMSLGESRVLDEGVAVIYYNHYDLGKEGTPEQSRGKPNPGKFYDIYGGDHSAGLLMAWAWGASRLIDVLQQAGSAIIATDRLGVTGCSRNGKGAFTVGVFDERIALTIPHETSTGGVPAYRIVDILNTERTDHNYFGLNWLSNDFEPFVYSNGTSNAVKLPIDTHSLVASLAPRGLLVLDNPHQTQMSAPAGHAATMGGLEVFKALGVQGSVSYHSSVAQTPHCSYKNEYTELLLQNIGRFLKHEHQEPGRIVVGSGGDGKIADWKDWETPTLESDVMIGEGI